MSPACNYTQTYAHSRTIDITGRPFRFPPSIQQKNYYIRYVCLLKYCFGLSLVLVVVVVFATPLFCIIFFCVFCIVFFLR